MYSISAICINFINDSFVYVCKYDMVTSFFQQSPNKTSADIACTKLNGFFHSKFLLPDKPAAVCTTAGCNIRLTFSIIYY